MNFELETEHTLNLEIKEIDLTKCRLCQQNDGNIEMLSDEKLCQQISICTGINVRDDVHSEKLPKFVCSLCKCNIDQFITFQENCIRIDERLKVLLEESKIDYNLIITTDIATTENEQCPLKIKISTNKKLIKHNKRKVNLKSVCKKCNQPKRGRHKCSSVVRYSEKSEFKAEDDSITDAIQLPINTIKKESTLKNGAKLTHINEIELKEFELNDSAEDIKNEQDGDLSNESDKEIIDYDIVHYDHDYDNEQHDETNENVNSEKHADNNASNKNVSNDTKQYTCDYLNCGKKFTSKLGYKKHVERHDSNYNLDDYENISDDEKIKFKKLHKSKQSKQNDVYVCNFTDCDKNFPTKAAYKQHTYNMHDIKEFLCPSCGKVFRRQSALKVHERIHLPTKEYVCTECDMRFAQQANLKTHIKLHHEGHRFYCTKCGKGFLTNVTLKRHELIHIGVKDFKCDMCPSAFYTRRELIKHKRYHYGIRPHFCSICYRTYVEKHHLTIHMRAHTGERPYACDVNGCSKAFAESQKLRRHKKNVHRFKVE